MDQNEYFSRQNFAAALSKAATGGATDEASARVIREAQANLAREKARAIMEEADILEELHLENLDELAELVPILRGVGFPELPRAVIYGDARRGIPDKPTTRLARHDYDRWREKFDALAQQLGYTKPVSTRSARKAVVAGVATLVGLFLR